MSAALRPHPMLLAALDALDGLTEAADRYLQAQEPERFQALGELATWVRHARDVQEAL